jgi:hypothetical protein
MVALQQDNVDNYSLREELRMQYISEYAAALRSIDKSRQEGDGCDDVSIMTPSQNLRNFQEKQLQMRCVNSSVDGGSVASSSIEELHLRDEAVAGLHGFPAFDDNTQGDSAYSAVDKLSGESFVKTPVGLARLPSGDMSLDSRGFSIVPKAVWEALRGFYGGGPVIPAIICNVLIRPVLSENEVDRHMLRGAWVDINPLMLHLSLCNALGMPMPTPKETVAYRMETMESFVSRVMSNFIRQGQPQDSRDLDLTLSDMEVCVGYLNNVYADYNKRRPVNKGLKVCEPLRLYDVLRVWTLVYDDMLHEVLEEEGGAKDTTTTAETATTTRYHRNSRASVILPCNGMCAVYRHYSRLVAS